MKKPTLLLILIFCSGGVLAQVNIDRIPLGSGTPGNDGVENAVEWDLNLYHAPQYMPGHPTASTIFPRAISVLCMEKETGLHCKGYNWLPEMGRTEYLMIRPMIVKEFPAQN
ncbi:hypothetical protein [Polaromonas naphthalenivorans]|uniref:Uncharacterized protein n=1 Tax=Polaromonas naphthalenivorans (strain CJ2) TaxID=365044 RepID=A1VIK1_POLNA|nr:hypothetical protein [Polaromonas naphthalenivorans]ABM35479.1 hypothetical protein Pnap_0154 [Polaromonas naphthalenivorans CJ2]